MFGKAKKAKASYGIVGLGRFGLALAIELAEAGEDLVVLDQEEEKVRIMRDYTEAAYVVNSLDKKTLEETGIQNCDVAVVCIGEKMDVSILTTLHLVSMGIPTVIAKAASEEQGQVLRKLGAQVVYPEHDMAIRLAHRLETTGMLDFVQLSEQVSISKLAVPAKMIGKTVVDVNLRGQLSRSAPTPFSRRATSSLSRAARTPWAKWPTGWRTSKQSHTITNTAPPSIARWTGELILFTGRNSSGFPFCRLWQNSFLRKSSPGCSRAGRPGRPPGAAGR